MTVCHAFSAKSINELKDYEFYTIVKIKSVYINHEHFFFFVTTVE